MILLKAVFINFAGLYAGMNKHRVSIDFSKCKNNIILLVGKNGSGKTTLLSNLHPFPYVESGDVRSSQDLIIKGKEGRKSLELEESGHVYNIDIHYLIQRDKRVTRCFIKRDGLELNQSGLVRSYYEILQVEFGIEPNFLRIIRLGPNVSDIITMRAAERKDFISTFLTDIEVYTKLHGVIKEESNYMRSQMKSLTQQFDSIGPIETLRLEYKRHSEEVSQMSSRLVRMEDESKAISEELDSLMSDSACDEAKEKWLAIKSTYKTYHECSDVTSIVDTCNSLSTEIAKYELEIQSLTDKIRRGQEQLCEYQSKITDFSKKASLIKASDGDTDIDGTIKECKSKMKELHKSPMMAQPGIYKAISNMWEAVIASILEIELPSISIYREQIHYCHEEDIISTIENFLTDKMNSLRSKSGSNGNLLAGKVFFIPTNCKSYKQCPYFTAISSLKQGVKKSNTESEFGTYQSAWFQLANLKLIQQNVSTINDYNTEIYIGFGDIMAHMVNMDHGWFKTMHDSIEELISNSTDYQMYEELSEKVNMLEQRKAALANIGGLDLVEDMISSYKESHDKLQGQLADDEKSLGDIERLKSAAESNLEALLPTYKAIMDYMANGSEYENIRSRYEEAKSVTAKRNGLAKSLATNNEAISRLTRLRDEQEMAKNNTFFKMQTKENLTKQISDMKSSFRNVELLREVLSSTKGIPLVFIQLYLKNIQLTANVIIRGMLNDTDIELQDFIITDKEFSIPYRINGVEVADVSYSSQGERATIVLALSFALLHQIMGRYNILLLDELDGALYKDNRRRFIQTVEAQMSSIGCKQAFVITHNDLFENYPVDIILTSDLDGDEYSKGNVIWSPGGED